MKTKHTFCMFSKNGSFALVLAAAIALGLGVPGASAQTGDYLYSGSEQTIILNPGLYYITAYGAQGGGYTTGSIGYGHNGGLGAEMAGEFDFTTATTVTLLVGGAGSSDTSLGGNGSAGGGGGGGSFVVNGTNPLVVAGGGGGGAYNNGGNGNVGINGVNASPNGGFGGTNGSNGTTGPTDFQGDPGVGYGGGGYISYLNGEFPGFGGHGGPQGGYGGGGQGGVTPDDIMGGGGGGGYSGGGGGPLTGGGGGGGSIIDPSAIEIVTEVSGIASPDDSPNGEIIITAVPEPGTLALAGWGGLSLLLCWRRHVKG